MLVFFKKNYSIYHGFLDCTYKICNLLLLLCLSNMFVIYVTDGKFWLGTFVATVPDSWLFEGNTKCYYPRSRGGVAAMKREPVKSNWEIYECKTRKFFSKLFNITI